LRFGKRPVLEHRTSGLLRCENAMNGYTTAEGQSSVPTDCSELEQRDVRALTEYMTVLPEMGRAEDAPDLYLVVSESGSEYLVDTREGACECPDAVNRDVRCKHLRRVRYATGETPVPAGANEEAIDDALGDHVEVSPGPLSEQTPEDSPTSATDTLRPDGGNVANEPPDACPNGEVWCGGSDGENLPCFACFEGESE
jgi:hypothetical protein